VAKTTTVASLGVALARLGVATLRSALHPLHRHYDRVLIDCPPSLGVLTLNGLTAADEVIIPLQPEALSHRGVAQLLEVIGEVRRLTNRRLEVRGVLPTLHDPRTRIGREVLGDVTRRYNLKVLDPPIRRRIRFAEAPREGLSIFDAAPDTSGAQAYLAHARKLARR
jgi:chromosome partitioning protein